MEKQIKLFLDFIEKDKKLSLNTLQSYERDIRQYHEYLDKQNINYLKVEKSNIEEYIEHLKELNKKTSTISRNIA